MVFLFCFFFKVQILTFQKDLLSSSECFEATSSFFPMHACSFHQILVKKVYVPFFPLFVQVAVNYRFEAVVTSVYINPCDSCQQLSFCRKVAMP